MKKIFLLILFFISSTNIYAQSQDEPGKTEYVKGENARNNEQWTDALKWFKLAAEKGNSNAMNSLGYMYHNGEGMDPNEAEALNWYRKAVFKGNTNAMIALGIIYLNNDLYLEAENSFKLAAEKKYPDGYEMLGYFYYSREQYADALPWLNKAVEKDMPMATFYLAEAYEEGNGLPENIEKAKELYKKAVKLGYKDAAKKLSNL